MLTSLVANLGGGIRRVKEGGRTYLVAPVTMIVPGVLPGSKGPLFYPLQEIRRNFGDWEGTPITLGHPTQNGRQVSASSSGILHIGRVRNVSAKGKLKGEAWIDEEVAAKAAPQVIESVRNGFKVEVSTGLYTDNDPAQPGASYLHRSYTHVAKNYRPDHLAVLMDQVGACILPGQEIQGRIVKASKARYSGEAIRLRTLSGANLSVTANHPILTVEGFIPAGQLTKGQDLLHYVGKNKPLASDSNKENAPAFAEEVFDALAVMAPAKKRVWASALDFHGDAAFFQSDVEVVSPHCSLRDDSITQAPESFPQGNLCRRGNSQLPLSSSCPLKQSADRMLLSNIGGIGGSSESLSLLSSQLRVHQPRCSRSGSRKAIPSQPLVNDPSVDPSFSTDVINTHAPEVGVDNSFNELGRESFSRDSTLTDFCVFGPASELNISLSELVADSVRIGTGGINQVLDGLPISVISSPLINDSLSNARGSGSDRSSCLCDPPCHSGLADALLFCKLIEAFPGKVLTDEIVEIERFHYEGSVYDFETTTGYIIAEKLIVSNCSVNDGCGLNVNARKPTNAHKRVSNARVHPRAKTLALEILNFFQPYRPPKKAQGFRGKPRDFKVQPSKGYGKPAPKLIGPRRLAGRVAYGKISNIYKAPRATGMTPSTESSGVPRAGEGSAPTVRKSLPKSGVQVAKKKKLSRVVLNYDFSKSRLAKMLGSGTSAVDRSTYTSQRASKARSSGGNCGTGAGGFKPGNTCAAEDKVKTAGPKLLDLEKLTGIKLDPLPEAKDARKDHIASELRRIEDGSLRKAAEASVSKGIPWRVEASEGWFGNRSKTNNLVATLGWGKEPTTVIDVGRDPKSGLFVATATRIKGNPRRPMTTSKGWMNIEHITDYKLGDRDKGRVSRSFNKGSEAIEWLEKQYGGMLKQRSYHPSEGGKLFKPQADPYLAGAVGSLSLVKDGPLTTEVKKAIEERGVAWRGNTDNPNRVDLTVHRPPTPEEAEADGVPPESAATEEPTQPTAYASITKMPNGSYRASVNHLDVTIKDPAGAVEYEDFDTAEDAARWAETRVGPQLQREAELRFVPGEETVDPASTAKTPPTYKSRQEGEVEKEEVARTVGEGRKGWFGFRGMMDRLERRLRRIPKLAWQLSKRLGRKVISGTGRALSYAGSALGRTAASGSMELGRSFGKGAMQSVTGNSLRSRLASKLSRFGGREAGAIAGEGVKSFVEPIAGSRAGSYVARKVSRVIEPKAAKATAAHLSPARPIQRGPPVPAKAVAPTPKRAISRMIGGLAGKAVGSIAQRGTERRYSPSPMKPWHRVLGPAGYTGVWAAKRLHGALAKKLGSKVGSTVAQGTSRAVAGSIDRGIESARSSLASGYRRAREVGSRGWQKAKGIAKRLRSFITGNAWGNVMHDRLMEQRMKRMKPRRKGSCGKCNRPQPPTRNAFCATGPGGGIDPTCGKGGQGGSGLPTHIQVDINHPDPLIVKLAKALYKHGKGPAIGAGIGAAALSGMGWPVAGAAAGGTIGLIGLKRLLRTALKGAAGTALGGAAGGYVGAKQGRGIVAKTALGSLGAIGGAAAGGVTGAYRGFTDEDEDETPDPRKQARYNYAK